MSVFPYVLVLLTYELPLELCPGFQMYGFDAPTTRKTGFVKIRGLYLYIGAISLQSFDAFLNTKREAEILVFNSYVNLHKLLSRL